MPLYPTVKTDLGGGIAYYHPPQMEPVGRFDTTREYAEAREKMAMVCVDGLPCGYTENGTPAVALVIRADTEESDGPFRGQPWVVGGKWNWIDTFCDFIRKKAKAELFRGTYDGEIEVPTESIGGKPIMVAWGRGTDGPYQLPAVSFQYCYRVILKTPFSEKNFSPDQNHTGHVIVRPQDNIDHLHAYVRDLITMSGWLEQKS